MTQPKVVFRPVLRSAKLQSDRLLGSSREIHKIALFGIGTGTKFSAGSTVGAGAHSRATYRMASKHIDKRATEPLARRKINFVLTTLGYTTDGNQIGSGDNKCQELLQ